MQLQPNKNVTTSMTNDHHLKRNLTFKHLIPTNFDDIREQVETRCCNTKCLSKLDDDQYNYLNIQFNIKTKSSQKIQISNLHKLEVNKGNLFVEVTSCTSYVCWIHKFFIVKLLHVMCFHQLFQDVSEIMLPFKTTFKILFHNIFVVF